MFSRTNPRNPRRAPSFFSFFHVIAVSAVLVAPTASHALTVGSWSSSRSAVPFAGTDFDEAQAALALQFPGYGTVSLEALDSPDLATVDLLIVDSIAAAAKLSTSEQQALLDFIEDGGTALINAHSSFSVDAANSFLDPFGISAETTLNSGVTAVHAVASSTDPIIDGPFGTVTTFSNRFETHFDVTGATGAEVLASDSGIGPVMVLLPRCGAHGAGQVLFVTNWHAFGDVDAFTGGLYSANATLFQNLAQSAVLAVAIDIKPGTEPNCFNNDGHGVIPVAILGSACFDVARVDAASVNLEGMAVKAVGKSNKLLAHFDDTNEDGFVDLVVSIEDIDGVFEPGSTIATITGDLLAEFGGAPFSGFDSICIVGGGEGGGGSLEPSGGRFLRGDSNTDASVDLGDALFTLRSLFSRGPAAACRKSADANDSGAVDLSDPVYLLNFLFLGGHAPSYPFAWCGLDPTPDALSCEAYSVCR